jgi:hypothetical protein
MELRRTSPGESVFLGQVPEIVIPPGLVEVKAAKGVQMVATRSMKFETRGWASRSVRKSTGMIEGERR